MDSALHFANNSIGTQNLYQSLSSNVLRYRSGDTANVTFSAKDRETQQKAGAKST